MAVREQIFSPEVQNRLVEESNKHFEKVLRLGIANVFPNGLMAGQEPETDTFVRLRALMGNHDRNLAMILDPNTLPGDAARYQAELFEEEQLKRLKREVFGDGTS